MVVPKTDKKISVNFSYGAESIDAQEVFNVRCFL